MTDPDLMDLDVRLVQANVRRRLFGTGAPTEVGRYQVLRRLGQGGMGVVFEGVDTVLKRHVALKLLRPGRDEGNQERMRREAEALAKLSHPNVVQIYGVEEVEGQLCLALELVEGQDLGTWLREHRPDVGTIVDLFVQAGEGLSAAHRAGLVHRDFKPSNVLVDGEGRARVTDFGTVAMESDPSLSGVPEDQATTTVNPPPRDALTRTGSAPGTPLYMSPEQHNGRRADARSDVYSFCLSLWEALAGAHPFRDLDYWPMVLAKQTRSLQPAAEAAIPKRLRPLLMAGLLPDPDRRPASMDEVLAQLRPRRRRGLWWAGVVGMTAALAVGLGGQLGTPPCEDAGQGLAAAWNDARRARLEERVADAPAPYGADAAQVALRNADAWATRWLDTRVATCRAHHVSGGLDATTHDERVACLDDRIRDLERVLEAADQVEGPHLLQIPAALASLDDPQGCADERRRLLSELSTDQPGVEPAVEGIRQAVVTASLGDYDGAIARLDEIEGSVDLDAHPQLRAHLLYERGHARLFSRDPRGLEDLQEAIDLAEAARADQLAALGWTALTAYAWAESSEVQQAESWLRRARSAVTRVGEPPWLVAFLRETEAGLSARLGRYEDAMHGYEHALRLRRELGMSVMARRVQYRMATLEVRRQRPEHALTLLDEAARIREDLGPGHPFLGEIDVARGQALSYLGRYEEAQAAYVRASELFSRFPWAASSLRGEVELGLTELALLRGDLTVAHAHATVAVERFAGMSSPSAIDARCNLGAVELMIGDLMPARERLRACAEGQRELLGEGSRAHGEALNNLGEVELALGELPSALESFQRSREILTAVAGPDDLVLGYPDKGEGLVWLAKGEPERARPWLESAYRRLAGAGQSLPPDLADLAWGLARARAQTGAPADAVLGPAREAAVLHRLAKDPAGLAEIERFIALHETTPQPSETQPGESP